MANSSIIGTAKNKIIREFIRDNDIVMAIGSQDVTSVDNAEKLIGTHIFNYNQNPNTLDKVGTFITVQVHIPKSYDRNKTFVNATVDILIISHEQHMFVDNVKKVTDNRNDYLSRLIDGKLNGRSGFGIGTLKLVSNLEGSFQKDYLYRQMIFEATDLNESLCKDE